MKSIFHYTKAIHLNSIFSDRMIKPATAFVDYEKPAVWCSTRQDFEPTAAVAHEVNGHFRPMSCEQMAEIPLYNPVRIEVTPTSCPHDWKAFVKLSGVSNRQAYSLEKVARKQGSRCEDWRVSFECIPEEQWISVAYYYDRVWRVIKLTEKVIHDFSIIRVDNLRTAIKSICEAKP